MRMSASTGENRHTSPLLSSGVVAAFDTASPFPKFKVDTTGVGFEQFHTVRKPAPAGLTTVKLPLMAVASVGRPRRPVNRIRFVTPASSLVAPFAMRESTNRACGIGSHPLGPLVGPAAGGGPAAATESEADGSTVKLQLTERAEVVTDTV